MISRATACPTPEVSTLVQATMVKQLREWEEKRAAKLFEKYWCGERGTWTIGDAGVGHVAHNNGIEGRWPAFTNAVCGAAGKSKQLKVDVFVGNMIKYIGDVSTETASKQIKLFKTHRFLSAAEMTPSQWSNLQLIDIRVLEHAHLYGSQAILKEWRTFVRTLAGIEGPQHTPPGALLITQRLQAYHDEYVLPEINRLDVECIVVPSMMGLCALDMDERSRWRTPEQLRAKLADHTKIYYDLFVTPAQVRIIILA